MSLNMGTVSYEDEESINKLKNLKPGDVLYSAGYDEATGEVDYYMYSFREYMPQPNKNESKRIIARLTECYEDNGKIMLMMKDHKREDGTVETVEDSFVNDIQVGVYFSKKDAFKAFQAKMKQIYEAAQLAYSNEMIALKNN